MEDGRFLELTSIIGVYLSDQGVKGDGFAKFEVLLGKLRHRDGYYELANALNIRVAEVTEYSQELMRRIKESEQEESSQATRH